MATIPDDGRERCDPPCGKVKHDRNEAERIAAIQRRKFGRRNIHRCGYGGQCWHVTSKTDKKLRSQDRKTKWS